MFNNKFLKRIGVLFCLVIVVFVFWQLVSAGVSLKELLLTAAIGTLLLAPLALVAAAIIARVTRDWTEWWKDLILGVVGLALFYLGIYGAFYTTRYTLVGRIVGAVGLVLAAATIILVPLRRVVKKEEVTPEEQ